MGLFLGFLSCSIGLYFCFYFHYSSRWIIEDLALIYVIGCSPMFSSKKFILSGLIFRSLIHFQFIFVYGVRKCSNFILLHVAVQFTQHHLLKRLSLPHCIFLPPLSKIRYQVHKGAWVYFWAFYLVPLVYISVLVPVPYCFDYCSL